MCHLHIHFYIELENQNRYDPATRIYRNGILYYNTYSIELLFFVLHAHSLSRAHSRSLILFRIFIWTCVCERIRAYCDWRIRVNETDCPYMKERFREKCDNIKCAVKFEWLHKNNDTNISKAMPYNKHVSASIHFVAYA